MRMDDDPHKAPNVPQNFPTSEVPRFPPEFQVIEQIGIGGQAIVYRARQLHLDREVALKVLHADPSIGNDALAEKKLFDKFQTEAKALSVLQHPNIVRLWQVGITNDQRPFLVYELIEGISLGEYFQKRLNKTELSSNQKNMQSSSQKNNEQRILSSIFTQIVAALDYAHNAGFVHADITPANIMLLGRGDSSVFFEVKLLDFGLARAGVLSVRNDSTPLGRTALTLAMENSGALAGSPNYMSPEQCKGEQIDARSDLYSLACILYESLTGRVPFEGDTTLDLMYKHVHAALPLPNSSISPTMNKMLTRAMSKNREDRFQTAKELGSELKAALRDVDNEEKSKQPLVIIASVLVLLLLSALAIPKISGSKKTKKTAEQAINKNPNKLAVNTVQAEFGQRPDYRLAKLKGRIERPIIIDGHYQDLPEMHAELEEIIRDAKSQPAMLYLAYYFQARLFYLVDDYKRAVQSDLKCLENSRVQGQDTVHSLHAYVGLMNSHANDGNWAEAEKYAHRAEAFLEKNMTATLADIKVPYALEPRPTYPAKVECQKTMGRIAVERKEYDKAMQLFELVREEYSAMSKLGDAVRPQSWIAFCWEKQGKPAKAKSVMDKIRTQILSLNDTSSRDKWNSYTGLRRLSGWYASRKMFADTKICTDAMQAIKSQLTDRKYLDQTVMIEREIETTKLKAADRMNPQTEF